MDEETRSDLHHTLTSRTLFDRRINLALVSPFSLQNKEEQPLLPYRSQWEDWRCVIFYDLCIYDRLSFAAVTIGDYIINTILP